MILKTFRKPGLLSSSAAVVGLNFVGYLPATHHVDQIFTILMLPMCRRVHSFKCDLIQDSFLEQDIPPDVLGYSPNWKALNWRG